MLDEVGGRQEAAPLPPPCPLPPPLPLPAGSAASATGSHPPSSPHHPPPPPPVQQLLPGHRHLYPPGNTSCVPQGKYSLPGMARGHPAPHSPPPPPLTHLLTSSSNPSPTAPTSQAGAAPPRTPPNHSLAPFPFHSPLPLPRHPTPPRPKARPSRIPCGAKRGGHGPGPGPGPHRPAPQPARLPALRGRSSPTTPDPPTPPPAAPTPPRRGSPAGCRLETGLQERKKLPALGTASPAPRRWQGGSPKVTSGIGSAGGFGLLLPLLSPLCPFFFFFATTRVGSSNNNNTKKKKNFSRLL